MNTFHYLFGKKPLAAYAIWLYLLPCYFGIAWVSFARENIVGVAVALYMATRAIIDFRNDWKPPRN